MQIQSINFSIPYFNMFQVKPKDQVNKNHSFASLCLKPQPACDMVSFTGVSHGGEILKKLSAYGVPDIYTGQIMLDPNVLERLRGSGVFSKPLKDCVRIISHYEDTLLPVDRQFFEILKLHSKIQPESKISDVVKQIVPEHKKLLLKAQQPIFENLIQMACDLPKDLFDEFSVLMNITTKRLVNDPVILPFSEREFKYKLKRIADEIKTKNKRSETIAVNTLIREAEKIFNNEPKGSRIYGRNIRKKFEYQRDPKIIKRNSENMQKFKEVFEQSRLRKNPDIIKLIENTSAKIHGLPSFAQFERKSFIHELKKITKSLKDRKFAQRFSDVAQTLPTSKENVSAFIVKYADDSSERIGSNMMMNGVCSVDHLVAKKNKGKNDLTNFGLSATEINRRKTNIKFDDWVRMHPEIYANSQKHVNRLIELYKAGKFAAVSTNKKKIDQTYIENLATTLAKISPKEKPIIIDLSKLYEK